MTPAEAIRKLRAEEGLTQQSLSILCGLSEVFIRHIEADRKRPSLRSLKKICDAVDRDMQVSYSPKNKVTSVSFTLPQVQRAKSFDERITALQERLYRDCLNLTKDSETAKDVQQEATYRALLYHYRYNEQSQLYTWLYALARNVYSQRRGQTKDLQSIEDYIETAEPESGIITQVNVRRYIDRLSPKAKQVYKLRLLNLSYKEIAEQLRITPDGAKAWYWTIKGEINRRYATDIHTN